MGIYRDVIREEMKSPNRPSQVALLIGCMCTEVQQENLDTCSERERDGWYIKNVVEALQTVSESPIKEIRPKVACELPFETSSLRQILVVPLTDNIESKIAQLNSLLPDNIVCYGARQVKAEFHPKYSSKMLDKRDYQVFKYILPSYALNNNFPYNLAGKYRVSDETLRQLNRILEKFEGVRVYRKYDNDFKNMNSSFVISAHTGHPWVKGDIEFVDLFFEGKGIVPLQVLSIVGVVVSYMRGLLDDDDASNALKKPLMELPMAPAKGLVLLDVQFGSYNEDVIGGNGELLDTLDWTRENEQINNFEMKIVKEIVRVVKYERVFERWLRILPYINYI